MVDGWMCFLGASYRFIYLRIHVLVLGQFHGLRCLLAVCTTSGRVKLYRFPFREVSTEWIEVLDATEMLYTYLLDMSFGESQRRTSESAYVITCQENVDNGCLDNLPISNLGKQRKRRRENATHVSAEEPDNLREHNTWQIVPVSVSGMIPLEKATKDSSAPLITVQQYVSRTAMLTPLIVAWSPILRTSGNEIAIPHSSSLCCSILASGLKCGRISFWRIYAPQCYSIVSTDHSCKTSFIGFLKAHNTWITSINWASYDSGNSKRQLILATGSSDGIVKIWQVNVEDLLQASEIIHASFSLLNEVVTIDSSPISVLSLTSPLQTPLKMLLAIGKGSGSFELWILDMRDSKFERVACYGAHDHIVTGLAWAFDGRCLYSCSQDNSMKSWIFHGNMLCEVNFPSNTPGLKSFPDVPYVFDSCFGLAVSPGNLAIAVARRFDSDLLNPMYQERTHKAAIEFLWIGGQRLDNSLNRCPNTDYSSFRGFSEEELFLWEDNILWSFNQYENLNRLLNIWDIVTALLSFKQAIPNYVDHILLKWLKSYFSSQFSISKTFWSKVSKFLANLSSRRLHLINIISRHVVLKNYKVDVMNSSYQGCTKEQINLWTNLRMNSENELQKRLVGISISFISSILSNSTVDVYEVGCWRPDEWLLLKQWVLLNDNKVADDLKFLVAEIGNFEKERLHEVFRSDLDERCSFCSAVVPFESTEFAVCSGVKNDDGVHQSHKLERCAVSMGVCSTKYSWFCMCCQRRSSKLAPISLFKMLGCPSDFKSFLESSVCKESLTPCCPFCGILLQRLQPEYLLSPSPV